MKYSQMASSEKLTRLVIVHRWNGWMSLPKPRFVICTYHERTIVMTKQYATKYWKLALAWYVHYVRIFINLLNWKEGYRTIHIHLVCRGRNSNCIFSFDQGFKGYDHGCAICFYLMLETFPISINFLAIHWKFVQ